jgi:hypothetical protein
MQQQAILNGRVRSAVNCPERLSLNSDDDVVNANNAQYNQFQINLQTPVLDPKRCQLIRATIPNIQLQLPDWGGLCFFYWALATASTTPTISNLRCIRLYPSYYIAPSGFTTFIRNRYINDPSDLVTLLNQAAGVAGDIATYNPYWVVSDVTFSYDTTKKQITFVGNTASTFYAPVGYADPILATVLNGTAASLITMPNANNVSNTTRQPQVDQYTLNLKVGYAMSGLSRGIQSFGAGPSVYADITNVAFANTVTVPVDSFPNLVYTNTVSIYLSFLSGASLTSNNRHNLLAVVPVQSGSLQVNNYIAATSNLLTRLSQTISNITVEMVDDANQPYLLPDSAVTTLEISFSYQDKNF